MTGHGRSHRLVQRSLCLLPLALACAPKGSASSTPSEPTGGSGSAAHEGHQHHDGGATEQHAAHHQGGATEHGTAHHHGGKAEQHAAHGHGPHAHAAEPNAAHDGHDHHRHHRFEDAEAWAEQFDDPSRDAWQRPEAVFDYLALAPDARVADLGAGTGYFTVRLARRVPQGKVLANDIEPDMVRYLGERAAKEGLGNVVPVQGKPDDPALPEAVDVAFMCNVYHHVEDRVGYFRKLAAQLRPGGRVVVVDFEKDAPNDVPGPPPAMRVAREALVAELASAGFQLVRADGDILPHQYIVELRLAAPTETKPKAKNARR